MFALAYGVGAYAISVLTFLYASGFVENRGVAHTLDGLAGDPGGGPRAWLGNACLIGLFAVPHSLMARPGFKRAWTRIVPAAVERSTYVLVSSLLLLLLVLCWTPIPLEVWNAGLHPAGLVLEGLSLVGWALVVASTFQIDHLELFGLRQVWSHAKGAPLPPPSFRIPRLYRWVRHPIYLGFLLAFWSTPRMTLGHLLFAALTTAYVLLAVRLEERDLARIHPEYTGYRARVPMLLPLPLRRRRPRTHTDGANLGGS